MLLDYYLKTHPKTHLIFDFDETIAHVLLPWVKWEEDIKEELIKIDKLLYEKFKDGPIVALENGYISKYPESKELIIKNSINFETKYFKDVIPNKKLMSFIKNAKNYQMFIWSSNTRQTIEKTLEKFNILSKFKKLVTRNELTFIKPDPEGFFKIYNPKIPKKNYLYIGDKNLDKEAAQNSGIDFYLEDYLK